MNWNAARTRVANRGIPPTDFLTDLAETIKGMPDFLFTPRPDDTGETDIYTAVKPELGPWQGLLHRKAAMCEVLRVDAGFESSWRMTEGADASNPAENDDETRSSGLWQVSYNSRGFGADLRGLLVANHIQNGADFQRRMKTDLNFAVLYTVSLLRHSIRWAGPIKRGEINHWLSRAAVAEWQEALGW